MIDELASIMTASTPAASGDTELNSVVQSVIEEQQDKDDAIEEQQEGEKALLALDGHAFLGILDDFSSSKTSQMRIGCKHLIHFCTNYTETTVATHLSLLKSNKNLDRLSFPFECLTTEVMSGFAFYMVNDARYNIHGTASLSAQSIQNYFSAVKVFFTQHHPGYKNKPSPLCFRVEGWRQLRAALTTSLKNRAKLQGVSLSKSRETLTDSDFKVIALVCLLGQSAQLIEFLAYTSLMYHVGGRGNETASRKFSDLTLCKHVSMLKYGTLLKIEILRDKNGVEQTNTLFPYASVNEWWKDWYFNTALSLFLKCQDGQYASDDLIDGQSPLFPDFFNAGVTDTVNIVSAQEKHQENLAKAQEKGETAIVGRKRVPSAVTGLYNKIFQVIIKLFTDKDTFKIEEKLNSKLGAHGPKRALIQNLTDANCNPLATVFR